MEVLSNSFLRYNDTMYKYSVNYSQSLYNFPITLNYGEKHDRTKYILSSGTSDTITLLKDGIFIYVIGENFGQSYCSLMVINTQTKQVENEVFLNSSDITNEGNLSTNILELTSQEQLKILFEYL